MSTRRPAPTRPSARRGSGGESRLVESTLLALALGVLIYSSVIVLVSSHTAESKRVTVNGRAVTVAEGARVRDITNPSDNRSAGPAWHWGKLHAIDGRIITDSAVEPVVFINGRASRSSDLLPSEAEIRIESSDDMTEQAETTEVDWGRDSGPLVWRTLWLPGAPGRERVLQGLASGSELPLQRIADPSPAISRRETAVAALTFDDGPDRTYTPQILDILAAKGVKATFFVVGSRIAHGRDLIARATAEGHSIQDHSWSHHHDFGLLNDDEVRSEMLETASAIEGVTGRRPAFFRPPQGALSPPVESMAMGNNFHIAMWNVDPQDWAGKSADEIYAKVTEGIGGGDIILLHDGGGDRSQTVAALPGIIDNLRSRGIEFVTLNSG